MPQSILDSHMKNVKDLAEKGTENLETAGLEKSGKFLFFYILEYDVIVAKCLGFGVKIGSSLVSNNQTTTRYRAINPVSGIYFINGEKIR